MDMKEKMIADFRKEVEAFYEHYLYLYDLMAVYGQMEGMDSSQKEKAPNFFGIVESACVDAYMMEFAKLYDEDKSNACSIPLLLEKCTKNISLFEDRKSVQDRINSFKNRLEEKEFIAPAIETIKKRRDKFFAHNDKKYFVDRAKDTTYLPTYQL